MKDTHPAIVGLAITMLVPAAAVGQAMSHGAELQTATKAVAVLAPTTGSTVHGIVRFETVPGGVHITAQLEGLSAGDHGFHIHEFGDCSAADGTSAGGHFNPTGASHAGPDAAERHVGDLGNITANAQGMATYDRVDRVVRLDLDGGYPAQVPGDAPFAIDVSRIAREGVLHVRVSHPESEPQDVVAHVPGRIELKLRRRALVPEDEFLPERTGKEGEALAAGEEGGSGDRTIVRRRPAGIALEGVDVVGVDPQDVIEGGAQRGEEARARCREFGGCQRRARAEQAVVRPDVVAGHGDEVAGKPHRRHGGLFLPALRPRAPDCAARSAGCRRGGSNPPRWGCRCAPGPGTACSSRPGLWR